MIRIPVPHVLWAMYPYGPRIPIRKVNGMVPMKGTNTRFWMVVQPDSCIRTHIKYADAITKSWSTLVVIKDGKNMMILLRRFDRGDIAFPSSSTCPRRTATPKQFRYEC